MMVITSTHGRLRPTPDGRWCRRWWEPLLFALGQVMARRNDLFLFAVSDQHLAVRAAMGLADPAAPVTPSTGGRSLDAHV